MIEDVIRKVPERYRDDLKPVDLMDNSKNGIIRTQFDYLEGFHENDYDYV